MPRTWQYSRWRRLALQGAMCLLLGLSVGAAAWIGQKRRQPAVVLGEVGQHEMLRCALPVGWKVETVRGYFFEVDADEPGPHGRLLRVSVEPPRRGHRTNAESLIAQRSRGPDLGEPITILGQEGLLVEASFRVRRQPGEKRETGGSEDDDDEGNSRASIGMVGNVLQGLFAAVALEDGTGVVVSLEGEAASGPSNRALIKRVIATMQRVPSTQPASQGATQGTRRAATQAASQSENR